ncbi:biotin-dependent carboxyltransferase [Sporolactobacillus sp. THM7-4]|nr:biotin-dependent carboxyltransferase [Sporolactobacillus sp. THM7-4]
MASIKCIKPGLLTTIQDKGRQAYQSMGISASGAMDKFAMRVGNILVGNPEYTPVIESAMVGPVIEMKFEGCVSITGANFSPKLNGDPIEMWKAIHVTPGDVLSFGRHIAGCLTYIAISGGLKIPTILGSCSTFIRGGYGGISGRALKAGDEIHVREPRISYKKLVRKKLVQRYILDYRENATVRFIWGPQDDRFTEESKEVFIHSSYKVSTQSDRMGYRMQGPQLKHVDSPDILSDYICPGAIQVPGEGQPIILMADCQMTGGYTKIGVVINVDFPLAAQCKPGDKIHFEPISVAEAQDLMKQRERFFYFLNKQNEALI